MGGACVYLSVWAMGGACVYLSVWAMGGACVYLGPGGHAAVDSPAAMCTGWEAVEG
jgi:hypothetical protein